MPKILSSPSFHMEKELWDGRALVVGVDEVGRGAVAGPVCAGACMFSPQIGSIASTIPVPIRDSKRMTPQMRLKSADWIVSNTLTIAVAFVSADTIDAIGIARATVRALSFAVATCTAGYSNAEKRKIVVLADYFGPHSLADIHDDQCVQMISGESVSCSIAAASIIAKVARDAHMTDLGARAPEFMWQQNKGYGTKSHMKAIQEKGATAHHRKTFLNNIL